MTATRTPLHVMWNPDRLRVDLEGAVRVVFDLDGTLYDTRDFERPALAAVVKWLRQHSGRPLDGLLEALWLRRETDRHRPGLFDELLAQYGLPVSLGSECALLFHDYPGNELAHSSSLKEQLNGLRAAGTRLALVTNGRPVLQRRKLHWLGLEEMFDSCVCCDPGIPQQLKPSSWAWSQLATWRSGLLTTYVGDDPVDAEFAHQGQARFIGFAFRSPSYAD